MWHLICRYYTSNFYLVTIDLQALFPLWHQDISLLSRQETVCFTSVCNKPLATQVLLKGLNDMEIKGRANMTVERLGHNIPVVVL
jgi:hypothetical protein